MSKKEKVIVSDERRNILYIVVQGLEFPMWDSILSMLPQVWHDWTKHLDRLYWVNKHMSPVSLVLSLPALIPYRIIVPQNQWAMGGKTEDLYILCMAVNFWVR